MKTNFPSVALMTVKCDLTRRLLGQSKSMQYWSRESVGQIVPASNARNKVSERETGQIGDFLRKNETTFPSRSQLPIGSPPHPLHVAAKSE
jgi:hypothetical protein